MWGRIVLARGDTGDQDDDLEERYMAARQANLEHLKLYFNVGAYVSANSRDGAWNIAAIETIFDAAVAGIARVAGGKFGWPCGALRVRYLRRGRERQLDRRLRRERVGERRRHARSR